MMRLWLLAGFSLCGVTLLSYGADTDAAARLDTALLSSLREEEAKLAPALPLADDLTFLRRLTVDLCGRLPTVEEINAVLLSAPQEHETWVATQARRAAWIERLLATDDSAEWSYQQLADTLRVQDAHWALWLREQVRADRPWNALVEEMLLAQGEPATAPATGLLLRDEGDRLTTGVALAGSLLGRDLHCARCHDHAFADDTQSGTYHWAACMPPVSGLSEKAPPLVLPQTYQSLLTGARPWGVRKAPPPLLKPPAPLPPHTRPVLLHSPEMELPAIALPSLYYYRDHRPGDLLEARTLPSFDRSDRRTKALPVRNRQQFAHWIVREQGHELARVAAQRQWFHFMGLAGMRPIQRDGSVMEELLMKRPPRDCTLAPQRALDWLRGDEAWPITKQLAREFEMTGFSRKRMARIICLTQAYHREARPDYELGRPVFTAQPNVRRLPAEVLWTTLTQWQANTDHRPADKGMRSQSEVPPVGHPLRLLGRSLREWPDQAYAPVTHAILRWLANGEQTQQSVSAQSLLLREAASRDGARHLFLSILSRPPSAEEAIHAAQCRPSDVAWALLQTSEFLFHH